MPLKKLNSLHSRLFAIVLLAMLPVLVMALLMTRDRHVESKANAVAASRQLAQQYSGEGKALFDRVRILLAEITALPEVQSLDSAACAQILAVQGRVHQAYGPIILSRPDGGIIASYRNRPGRPSPLDRSLLRDVLLEKTFLVGGYQAASGTEPERLPVALPVLAKDGSVLAVLSMSLDLRVLADLLDDLALPEGAAVSIIDRAGTILARYPADSKAVGQPAPEAKSFLPGVHSREGATWESAGVDGVERIYFIAPLLQQGQRDIVLRVGMPKAQVLAAADQGLVRDLSFIAAMTLLAFFTTWLFSNAFVLKQVKKLWLATRQMSEGDYAHRIGATGCGELVELSMAFDGMADVLESKTASLTTAERKYRKIFEHSVNGIFQTTPEGRMLEANPALASMLGYDSPEALIKNVRDIGSQLYAEPEIREEVLRRLWRDGVISGFEMPAKRANGERIWVSLNVHVVHNNVGIISYFEGSAADITYRKTVEQELCRKQEKLQALLDHSPALITIKDAQGRYVLGNRMHQEVHGLDRSAIGKSMEDLFTPEEARRIREEDRKVLAEGRPQTFQRAICIKGVVRHFLAAKFPLCDESGRPDRVCSISYDVTEYEQVREALRQSEEKYRTMIQTSPDLIWMVDPQGFVVESNIASRDLLGYDPEELRGMHLRQLLHPEDMQAYDRDLVLPLYVGMKKALALAPSLINERRGLPRCSRDMAVRLRPRGSVGSAPDPRQFELSSCGLWQNMTFLGTMLVIRDVTERKQAEQALRENQELLAQTQSLGQIGGWSVNLETRARKWTDELRILLGYEGETLPDLEEAAAFVSPEDRHLYIEAVRKAEDLGEAIDVELRLVRQGACQRWVRFIGRRTDKDGARVLTGSFQDITDRKNLDRLRDDIDNIIRHDLKTPLNGIINLPQIIMSGSNLTPEQIEYLRYIEMGGIKMLRQVEMSLDIMKIERGHYRYNPYPFDLLAVIKSIAKEMQGVVQRKKLSLEVLLEGEPITESSAFRVLGEERLCSPLLSNLIANAFEASPVGERIAIALRGGAEPVVSIRNVGAVPLDIRERLFEKFVTSGKAKGTGLGTYSARLFAMAQGGTVELDASEEGATIMLVRLPGTAMQ